jgi:hypothetical protein
MHWWNDVKVSRWQVGDVGLATFTLIVLRLLQHNDLEFLMNLYRLEAIISFYDDLVRGLIKCSINVVCFVPMTIYISRKLKLHMMYQD